MRQSFASIFVAVAALPALLAGPSLATTYGTLGNFDVANDTPSPCHGFEIELEDIRTVVPQAVNVPVPVWDVIPQLAAAGAGVNVRAEVKPRHMRDWRVRLSSGRQPPGRRVCNCGAGKCFDGSACAKR